MGNNTDKSRKMKRDREKERDRKGQRDRGRGIERDTDRERGERFFPKIRFREKKRGKKVRKNNILVSCEGLGPYTPLVVPPLFRAT